MTYVAPAKTDNRRAHASIQRQRNVAQRCRGPQRMESPQVVEGRRCGSGPAFKDDHLGGSIIGHLSQVRDGVHTKTFRAKRFAAVIAWKPHSQGAPEKALHATRAPRGGTGKSHFTPDTHDRTSGSPPASRDHTNHTPAGVVTADAPLSSTSPPASSARSAIVSTIGSVAPGLVAMS